MDESDEELAERLRRDLEGSGRRTAFQDSPDDGSAKGDVRVSPQTFGHIAGQGSGAQGDVPDAEDLQSLFFQAMNAYRAARNSGDREAMAEAERILHDVVRDELRGGDTCPDEG